jgi:hypothetical protein
VRDLARFLAGRQGKRDWALADVHDIEAFLAALPKAPASAAYTSDVLDSCGVPPRMLRCTRLADLVNAMDPSWSPPRSA